MSKIQIFSVLGKNGIMFANFLRENMNILASKENELEFNCFMNSKIEPPQEWKALEYILKQGHTSLNHTTGLNRAIDYIDGDYVVFSDTDIAILIPDWDKHLIEIMKQKNLDILGIDHWNHHRGYRKFPVVTFFIAKSVSYLLARPDLRPTLSEYSNKYGKGAKEYKIQTVEDSIIYKRSKGSTILLDSGWQLPYKFKTIGLRGDVLPKGKEYEIQYVPQVWKINEQLAIAHKGKGSKRRQSQASKFIKSCKSYIEEIHKIKL